MAISLYDYTLSGSCYKVRLLLDFLGLDYKRIQIGFYPAHEYLSADFEKINPLKQIPVLEDEGLRIRDAQAILCYLAKKYDKNESWLPNDPSEYGLVMMWLMFAGGELMASSAARLHDVMGFDFDIVEMRKNTRIALRILDDHMAKREITGHKWIVGNHPTIADIACFPYIALSGDGGIGHEDYPSLRNWMREFRKLPRFNPIPGIPEFA